MTGLLIAASAFFLLHLFPSTPLRKAAVSATGERAYLGVFSVLSLILIIWLVMDFEAAPYGTKLWSTPAWWLWCKAVLILIALIFAVSGLLSPNPSVPGAGRLLERRDAAGGIFAITRHPVMWGAAIWAAAHAITQATPRGLIFFGSLAATALIGSWLQEQRKRATIPGWGAFEDKTSFFPFMAISEGRAKLSLTGIGLWRIAIAVLLWAAILHFHTRLFGAQPLPLHS
jgi:uncharacterized membrane protein